MSVSAERGAATVWDTQMLASVAVSSQDSIHFVDDVGVIMWANPATERVLGWTAEDLVGQHASVLVPPEARDQLTFTWESIRAGVPVPPYTSTRIRRDGSVIDVAVTAGAVCDAGGQVVGISTMLRDVTEELRTERELKRALEAHRARFEQAVLPQALVALDGSFLSVNEALCRMLGRSEHELIGTKVGAVAHPLDSEAATAELIPLALGQVESATYERLARRADGQAFPVLLDVTLLRQADGTPDSMAMFARDLTAVREAQQRVTAQQIFFQALSRRSWDAAVVLDAEHGISYVSPSVTELFGYQPDEVVKMLSWDFMHADDVDRVRPLVDGVVADPERTARFSYRLRDGWGRWRWVEQTLTNCLGDPDINGLVINLRDITEQVEAEQALRDSESRYRAIVRTAQEGIVAVDADGHTMFANEKIAEITGIPLERIYQDGLLGSLPAELAADLDRRRVTRVRSGPEEYEVGYRHPDGTDRILSVSSSPLDLDDGAGGVLSMVSDVTDARQTENRLRWQAMHDPLTGLPNRSLLADRLEMATVRLERTPETGVAVLFMDLDQFKLVNDSRGHAVGDKLLCEVARRLQATVRRADTVARLGGDEFAIVCEDIDQEAALQLADRIHEVLRDPVDVDGEQLYAGTSIGIAMRPPHSADALLRFADAAMYRAKASTEVGTVLFDEALATDSERRFEASNALREALPGRKVRLEFQPIYDLTTGVACGVEALLHGIDARCGEVTARELMEIADESGLAFELDRAVLQTAVTEFARLRDAGTVPADAYVSVNLSTRTLGQALDIVVDQLLAESRLPGPCLLLEFTDNSFMTDADHVIASLARLRERGVGTSIDNFGAGNSSLVQLRTLPLSALRIDPWFVEQVGGQAESDELVRAVISLAKAIGLCTLAGGIENAEQAAAMRAIGCERGAGRYWTAPVAADELGRVFAGR